MPTPSNSLPTLSANDVERFKREAKAIHRDTGVATAMHSTKLPSAKAIRGRLRKRKKTYVRGSGGLQLAAEQDCVCPVSHRLTMARKVLASALGEHTSR